MADELKFDWDQGNIEHIARHNVAPAEAEQALGNDPIDLDYDVFEGEERSTSIGHTDGFRVLYVVWTVRGGMIRVVTARDAGKAARREYLRRRGLLT